MFKVSIHSAHLQSELVGLNTWNEDKGKFSFSGVRTGYGSNTNEFNFGLVAF